MMPFKYGGNMIGRGALNLSQQAKNTQMTHKTGCHTQWKQNRDLADA